MKLANKNRCFQMLMIAVTLGGCQKKGALSAVEDPRVRRDTALLLEECELEGAELRKSDADGDGDAEVTIVIRDKQEVCRSSDLNFDGKAERVTFYDQQGRVRRVQSDYDREGRVDEIAIYENGELVQKQRVTKADGRLDTWDFYESGKLVSTERDENGDGIIDQWWEYSEKGCPVVHVDANRDGLADPGSSINYCPEEEMQGSQDNSIESRPGDSSELQDSEKEESNEPSADSSDSLASTDVQGSPKEDGVSDEKQGEEMTPNEDTVSDSATASETTDSDENVEQDVVEEKL